MRIAHAPVAWLLSLSFFHIGVEVRGVFDMRDIKVYFGFEFVNLVFHIYHYFKLTSKFKNFRADNFEHPCTFAFIRMSLNFGSEFQLKRCQNNVKELFQL